MINLKDPEVKELHALCSFLKFETSYLSVDVLVK